MDPIGLATANQLSPMVRFFALGLDTARLRSSLSCPEAVSRCLAIYLLAAIGFKGGPEHFRTSSIAAFWSRSLRER